jgi:hypothetical protein
MEILGHILGAVAVLLFVSSYQLFDKRKLLMVQTAATVMLSLQYLCLGAYSGLILSGLCIVRNVVYYKRDSVKLFRSRAIPFLFGAAMEVCSIFAWDGWHSVFILAGIAGNTVCMGLFDAQGLRKSILFTHPMIFTYNCFEGAVAGAINEGVSIISAAVGIIRYNKSQKK